MNICVVIGNYGVAEVKCYLEHRGYMVSTCPEGQPTDLIVTDFPEQGLVKANHFGFQVKTTKQYELTSITLKSTTTSGQCIRNEENGEDDNKKYEREYIPGDFDIQCNHIYFMNKNLFIPFHFVQKKSVLS